ncbi:lectin like domain-containing protein [Methanosarcina sp.]|uniref:lectin like domain-containing protein n=1 Tax=Methanosarcina sp. TaxID=2213 RepID=UPI002ABC4836|nr:lectin like domain-containing protein [Methanosarcina sp.]MDY9924988.1 lectin like domain-containing protein [Methanosarcina sp.]
MEKNIDIKHNENIIKRAAIFSGLFVLFLILGSSVAVAENDPQSPELALNPELAPENPAFIEYQENNISPQPEPSLDGHESGLIPAPLDLSYISDISVADSSTPAYYDLRTLDKVTTVKDQGNAGTCWAFASYASLESYLKPGENWDFSENNMKNLLSSAYSEGFDRDPNGGGNRLQAAAYLSRWSGPVKESDDPYSTSSGVSPEGLPIKKHIQDILFIPNRAGSLDNEGIKWAVQKYGAVYTSMYYYNNSTFYSPANYSYYYDEALTPNHAVAIVGWNDSFDRNRFSQVPPGDGAFIMKNSWGSDWGDSGYFYVSYYDSNAGNGSSVFTAENPDNYEYIYQYDPFGWVSSLGYANPTAWCANVFTANSEEALKAVSFYTTDSNCNYEIYIYTNPGSGPISQAGPVLSKNGTCLTAGYHTIPLDSEVRLMTGQKFSVVLKLTNPTYRFLIALEKPKEDWSSKAKANSGESFISSSGITWTNVNASYPNANVCIKAFTDSVLLPVANFNTNVTEGYVPLSVQFTDLSGNATERSWDFENDGNIDSTEANPVYMYSAPGYYTVNLTATNENGTDSKLGTITVLEQPLPPVAKFYSDITQGYAPLSVRFTDISENATERIWNFGDGTYSTAVTPVHKYNKAGKYTVSLTVNNINGTDTETKSKYILVSKK